MTRYIVATVEEIPPGERKIVEVAGRSIGVFNLGGEFFALRNRCPHQGGPLCAGTLGGLISSSRPGEYHYSRAGELVRCPWHGWEFDIRTGQSWFDPAGVYVRRYEVTVAGTPQIGLERGPYVAETYPVAVERRHVIVEVPA
jgi:3-phenylpropionate/trans-cinnamate dioxygenase ferredoxin subunit